jgi:hypothetical protein
LKRSRFQIVWWLRPSDWSWGLIRMSGPSWNTAYRWCFCFGLVELRRWADSPSAPNGANGIPGVQPPQPFAPPRPPVCVDMGVPYAVAICCRRHGAPNCARRECAGDSTTVKVEQVSAASLNELIIRERAELKDELDIQAGAADAAHDIALEKAAQVVEREFENATAAKRIRTLKRG